jgi:acetylornithine deacetylase/succinyl-diaminopimelate desuccinylase-like protein
MINPKIMPDVANLHRELAAHPAWEAIADRDAVVEAAITIQQIPAPTFAEERRARYVYEQMQTLGLHQVSMDDVHNVYGCLPGSGTGAILVSAHTDTVFPQETDLSVRREGDRIYGPGLSDNSISVAAMLHLAHVLRESELDHAGTIWFVANTGEEGLGDLRGMRAAIDRLADQVDAVIVLDAQYGTIVHAGVASRRYRIGVQAPGGHSWLDFGAPSAVHMLVRLAAQLADLQVPTEPKTTFNVGVIEGGTTVNAIAQQASLLLDLRSTDVPSLEALVQQAEQIVGDARAAHRDVTITTEIVGDRPGGSIEQTHPLVELARAAYEAVGAMVTFDSSSTDANVPLSRNIPAVCVGMSKGGNVHRLDEYLDLHDIGNGMRAVLLLTLAAARR